MDKHFNGGFVQKWDSMVPKIVEFLKTRLKDKSAKEMLDKVSNVNSTVDKGMLQFF